MDLLHYIIVFYGRTKHLHDRAYYLVRDFPCLVFVILKWLEDQLHELNGWGINGMSFLFHWRAKPFISLAHYERKSDLNDSFDVVTVHFSGLHIAIEVFWCLRFINEFDQFILRVQQYVSKFTEILYDSSSVIVLHKEALAVEQFRVD